MGGRSCDRHVMFVVAPSGSMLRKEATVPKTRRVQPHPTHNSPQPLTPIIQLLPNPILLSNPRARIPIHNLMPLLTPTLHLGRHRRLRFGGVAIAAATGSERGAWHLPRSRKGIRKVQHLGYRATILGPALLAPLLSRTHVLYLYNALVSTPSLLFLNVPGSLSHRVGIAAKAPCPIQEPKTTQQPGDGTLRMEPGSGFLTHTS